MKSREEIESFLIQSDVPYEEVGDGMWVLKAAGDIEQVVIKYAPPLVVFRVNVMNVPTQTKEECFRTLLELNATDMVHGAYGIENDKIVITGALPVEHLDFNEFQAMIDDITLAVADHYSRLSRFRDAEAA